MGQFLSKNKKGGNTISYTEITALGPNVPRQVALDLLHSHQELIKLNKLVTDVKKVDAQQDAKTEEYLMSDWYEITEKMARGPGTMTFKGCWTDREWGVESYTFKPKLFDMRSSYRIGGNQPGEPREESTTVDGLYLKEDINIDCRVPMMDRFVEKEMREASKTMIERMKRIAELLEKGDMVAMFEKGKMKTAKAGEMDGPVAMDSPRYKRGSGGTFETQQSAATWESKGVDNSSLRMSSDRWTASPAVELPGKTGQDDSVVEMPGSEPDLAARELSPGSRTTS